MLLLLIRRSLFKSRLTCFVVSSYRLTSMQIQEVVRQSGGQRGSSSAADLNLLGLEIFEKWTNPSPFGTFCASSFLEASVPYVV